MNHEWITHTEETYRNPFSQDSATYTSHRMMDHISLMHSLDDALQKIQGQNSAIEMVKSMLFSIISDNPEKPKVMFFVGQPGCGKTECANIIAKVLNCGVLLLDGSELTDSQTTDNLIFGSTASFRNAHSGVVPDFCRRHPYGVIIIDEPEKACFEFSNYFLRALNNGSVHDNYTEREINCANNLIIFTSNAARKIWDKEGYALTNKPVSMIIQALREEKDNKGRQRFSDAFLSRVSGGVILFNNLSPQIKRKIVSEEINVLSKKIYDTWNLKIEMDNADQLSELVILNSGESTDLRTTKAKAQSFLNDITRKCVDVSKEACNDNNAFLGRIHIKTRFDDASEDALRLINSQNPARVLVSDMEFFKRKDLPKNVELIVAGSSIDAREVNSLDVSLAILDAKNPNTRQTFDAVIAQGDIPAYIYSKERSRSDLFYYYIDHGATATSDTDLEKWASDIIKSIPFTYAMASARRSGKIVNFDYAIQPGTEKYVMDVIIHNIRTERALYMAEQSNCIAEKDYPDVDFSDIIGAKAAKKELKNVARFLKDYKKYRRAQLRIPRGVLLSGDPGTGKTLLAKALASYCGFTFFSINATKFLQKHIGEGAKAVRDLFADARRSAPSIIFIDEFDIIARSRMSDYGDSHFTNDIVNALLSELDGFDTQNQAPVLVVAATNFDITGPKLDSALLRRFDHKLVINRPTCEERKAFLKMEIAKIPNNSVTSKQISVIAQRAIAYSLSDLNLVIQNGVRQYEAATLSVGLDNDSLNAAFESFREGEERTHPDEKTMEQTAYHEAGHSVLGCVLNLPILQATIIPRRNHNGFVLFGEEAKSFYSKQELLNQITVLLAGRASEIAFYGQEGVTTGASADIQSATNIANRMICEYGMSDDGSLLFVEQNQNTNLSEQRAKAAKILEMQYERAQKLISDYREAVQTVAHELMRKNSLSEEEIKAIMNGYL